MTVYSIGFIALLDVACLYMYICQCNAHEGEVKGSFIAVHAMKSTVEGRGEDLREGTATVVGLGRLCGQV